MVVYFKGKNSFHSADLRARGWFNLLRNDARMFRSGYNSWRPDESSSLFWFCKVLKDFIMTGDSTFKDEIG